MGRWLGCDTWHQDRNDLWNVRRVILYLEYSHCLKKSSLTSLLKILIMKYLVRELMWPNNLCFIPKFPPVGVIVGTVNATIENVPAISVHNVTVRQKDDLLKSHVE